MTRSDTRESVHLSRSMYSAPGCLNPELKEWHAASKVKIQPSCHPELHHRASTIHGVCEGRDREIDDVSDD